MNPQDSPALNRALQVLTETEVSRLIRWKRRYQVEYGRLLFAEWLVREGRVTDWAR